MRIQCLGLSHQTADVALREKIALCLQDIPQFVETLEGYEHAPDERPQIAEFVVLSTCNRVEMYVTAPRLLFDELEAAIAECMQLTSDMLNASFYRLVDEQVVSHLFRVAAGLDSMVLGEPQILGQVTEAYQMAHDKGFTGKRLSKLFMAAIHAGKRVRTDTAIAQKPISVPSLATKLAAGQVPDLASAQIVLLGAGEMAELAMGAFRKRGATNFIVISRTLASACKIADTAHSQTGTMELLSEALEKADILVSSSSAPHTLIDRLMVEQAMQSRPDRPMVILDIAVPRDVEPEVGQVPNVRLYNIDDLQEGVEASQNARTREVPKAEQILNQEYRAFLEYLSSLKVVPVIKEIRRQAERIREAELDKAFRRLPDLTPDIQEQITAMSQSIVKKILHSPTARLRQESTEPDVEQFAELARALFGLDASNNGKEL